MNLIVELHYRVSGPPPLIRVWELGLCQKIPAPTWSRCTQPFLSKWSSLEIFIKFLLHKVHKCNGGRGMSINDGSSIASVGMFNKPEKDFNLQKCYFVISEGNHQLQRVGRVMSKFKFSAISVHGSHLEVWAAPLQCYLSGNTFLNSECCSRRQLKAVVQN